MVMLGENTILKVQSGPKKGVFWLVDEEILAIPYDENSTVGLAKSGE